MKVYRLWLFLFALLTLVVPPSEAAFIQQISVATDGSQGSDDGDTAAADGVKISGDGNYVAFVSSANNLVPNDTATSFFSPNVFLRKLSDGTITKVSVKEDGTEFGDEEDGKEASVLALSETGRFVVFGIRSAADTNDNEDVYIRDMQSGTLTHIAAQFTRANFFYSLSAAVSADGSRVLFTSNSSSLFPGGNNAAAAFLYDAATQAITPVSTVSGKQTLVPLYAFSNSISLSADGQTAAFCASIRAVFPGNKNPGTNVFLRDLTTGAIIPAVQPKKLQTAVVNTLGGLSGNGQYLAFSSTDALASNDTNQAADVYVLNRQTGTVQRASLSVSGTELNGASAALGVSNDGRFVLFQSSATNIVPGTIGDGLYLRDLTSNRTTQINVASNGDASGRAPFGAVTTDGGLTESGRMVAFATYVALAPDDDNDDDDAYLFTLPADAAVPPAAAISAPLGDATLPLGTPVSVTGQVVPDNGRTVLRVSVFAGNTLVGTSTSSGSFSFQFTPVEAGSYNLSVVAVDDLGVTTITSVPIIVPAVYTKGVTYTGLMSPEFAQFAPAGGGTFTLTSVGNGTFSGKAVLNGVALPVNGRFQPDGSYHKTVKIGGASYALAVQYVFIAPDTHSERVTVKVEQTKTNKLGSSSESFVGTAERTSAELSETIPAGIYSLIFPRDPDADDSVPSGFGYAVLRVMPTGSYQLGGTLADGTPLNLRGNLTRGLTLPISLPRAQGAGFFQGNMQFRTVAGRSDLDGTIRWVSPKRPLYPNGFDESVPALGSVFTAPAAGSVVLNLAAGDSNAELLLRDGGLDDDIVATGTLNASTKAAGPEKFVFAAPNAAKATLTVGSLATTGRFNPAAGPGLFHGTFFHPKLKRQVAYKGIFFQKQNIGLGFFTGSDSIGAVYFGAPVYQTHVDATGLPANIPLNDAEGLDSTVAVSTSGKVVNVAVSVQATADFFDHLVVKLTSPTGTTVTVYDSDDDFDFFGSLELDGLRVAGFAGESPNGNWTLSITDDSFFEDPATLDSFSLDVTAQ